MDGAFIACANNNIVSDNNDISKSTKNNYKGQCNANDLHHAYAAIHTMSDQIPVYGLTLSRLHRLEM